LAAWEKEYAKPTVAFRASSKFAKDGGAVAAWLRQGERRAAEIACRPFDKTAFRMALLALRALTIEPDPKVFIPRLVETCAVAGVAVVFEAAPRGCPASGVTRWLTPEKALLMLSLRHKTNDRLWFSFFHEAGHLLLHGKRLVFIESEDSPDKEKEEQADTFARDFLIPPKQVTRLANLPKTKAAVRAFATDIGIAPGIVVGRMQEQGWLSWQLLNGLKVRYQWVSWDIGSAAA